jgi:N utilization substance protein B
VKFKGNLPNMSQHPTQKKESAEPKAPHPRRLARELTVQGIYQWLITNENAVTIRLHLEERMKEDTESTVDQVFFQALWEGFNTHKESFRPILEQWLDRPWTDVNYVERSVMILGAYELIHCPDIPLKVVINEALEVYKTFGGSDGHRYVNSILDKCAGTYRKGL